VGLPLLFTCSRFLIDMDKPYSRRHTQILYKEYDSRRHTQILYKEYDSRRHTQILYKEYRKNALRSTKKQKEQKEDKPYFFVLDAETGPLTKKQSVLQC
jgi:hypothetical protein